MILFRRYDRHPHPHFPREGPPHLPILATNSPSTPPGRTEAVARPAPRLRCKALLPVGPLCNGWKGSRKRWDRTTTTASQTASAAGSSAQSVCESRHTFKVREVGDTLIICTQWLRLQKLCSGPFFDPVTSSNCSHTFCRRCIIQHTIASHGKSLDAGDDHVPPSTTKRDDWILACPACRSPGRLSSFKPSPPLVRNLVDSLTVLCPMFGRGCQWSGERAYVDYHLRKDCGYVWIGEIEPSDANNTRDVPSDDKEGGDSVDPASPSEPSTSHRKSKPRCECGAKIYRKDWYLHQAKGCSARWKTCHWCHELIKEEEDEREEEVGF